MDWARLVGPGLGWARLGLGGLGFGQAWVGSGWAKLGPGLGLYFKPVMNWAGLGLGL